MSGRWGSAVAIVFAAFFAAGLLGAFFAGSMRLWYQPVIGFFAAFAVVLSAYLSAPHHKLASAMVAFVVGAVLAWFLLESSSYPESYGEGLAYQPTRLPVVVTYAGGLLGCAVSAMLDRWVGSRSASGRNLLRGPH